MVITWQTVITAGAVLSALGVICGIGYGIIKWFQKQNRQSDDIEDLKALHNKDMRESREKEKEDMQEIKDELCVISYGLLAALDGLQQLHCNGNVSRAYDKLEKHLNQRAHNQV